MRKFSVVKVSFNMRTLDTTREVRASGLTAEKAAAVALALNDKITGERDLAHAFQVVRETA